MSIGITILLITLIVSGLGIGGVLYFLTDADEWKGNWGMSGVFLITFPWWLLDNIVFYGLRSRNNIKGLILELGHKSWKRRRDAANVLGNGKDRRAVEPLIAVLKDNHDAVRREAAWALGRIGDSRAVEPLCDALLWSDRIDDATPSAAARALGEIGDPRAVETLIAALKLREDVAGAAAWALGKIDETAFRFPVDLMPDIPRHPR